VAGLSGYELQYTNYNIQITIYVPKPRSRQVENHALSVIFNPIAIRLRVPIIIGITTFSLIINNQIINNQLKTQY